MGKMSELDAVVHEIGQCGEILVRLSSVLREIFGTDITEAAKDTAVVAESKPVTLEAVAEEQQVAPAEPVVTYDQLRGTLAEKAAAGHRADVQALIRRFGADKLSAVAPENYAAMMAEAEAM